MATLDSLKCRLRQIAIEIASTSIDESLFHTRHGIRVETMLQRLESQTYQEFVIPQLIQLLTPILKSRLRTSVLEIGPGPKSVLGSLPIDLRRTIRNYVALEPINHFASSLEEWLRSNLGKGFPLPGLESPPNIQRVPFGLDNEAEINTKDGSGEIEEKFDIILFCHSMYGMKQKHQYIKDALDMLVEQPGGAMVVVFHRDINLNLGSLVCHKISRFPTGVTRVAVNDKALDSFAAYISRVDIQDIKLSENIRVEWRRVCQELGYREENNPGYLMFSSPEIMMAFTKHATSLAELTAQVPLSRNDRPVKNPEARMNQPSSILRPENIRQVQHCVKWALKRRAGLTVIGGSHSGHCLISNIVAIDMSSFDEILIEPPYSSGVCMVHVQAGCTTGDVIHKTMSVGKTVPLGSRPSVGSGLWLQGGIGHLSRIHGLSSDNIIGAVIVSVDSGEVICLGNVGPAQTQLKLTEAELVPPNNHDDLLWAIKGAGSNFGVVVSVTFNTYPARTYAISNWIVPVSDKVDANLKLQEFDKQLTGKLCATFSMDAYIYSDNDKLQLAFTMIESCETGHTTDEPFLPITPLFEGKIWGVNRSYKIVDSVTLFDTDIYMSIMHGGHGNGKTSSFKRCLFLKNLRATDITDTLTTAVESRPTPRCYVHLLHGGAAVSEIATRATSFGCRDWEFACVINGVWLPEQEGTEAARAAVDWVYKVAKDLLPISCGAYGADLGPDPRDTALAAKAFGANLARLARLKRDLDPNNVLAYACPLPERPLESKVIILVTGESGAGKDYSAAIWKSESSSYTEKRLVVRVASIGDAIKREYGTSTGADLELLLEDRDYKEKHRSALTAFYKEQTMRRPNLAKENFLDVVYHAAEVDVLLITGLRDKAPLACLSHLVPDSRLLEVYVRADEKIRGARRGFYGTKATVNDVNHNDNKNRISNSAALDYAPTFIFDNNPGGDMAAKQFFHRWMLPFFHDDLQRLGDMVRSILDFPSPDIAFRHVLGITQEPGGLALCTSLLQSHFNGHWTEIDAVVCCEAGGFIFAAALAAQVSVPLALIRGAGKLPPPTISVTMPKSHISAATSNSSSEKIIEMEEHLIPRGGKVVIIDDVLATGNTVLAMVQLLDKAGISPENITVMAVVEFPVHRGRQLLYAHGYGKVLVQSLLVFGGT